ncbi:MAG: carbamoyl-phosphate synthase large subunit, partial [Bacillus sp. (in: firmicutes)]
QLGETRTDLCSTTGLMDEPNYFSVKTPVFSSSKLKGVDHVLGPEMKSTGEALGLGITYQEALEKSIPSLGGNTEENYIFCSIYDRDKQASLPIIQELVKKHYKIAATEGTALFFQKHGILVGKVIKNDAEVIELFRMQSIKAVINIPNQGRNKIKFGFQIREHAVRYKIPVFTHLDTIEAIVDLEKGPRSDYEVRSVTEYYKLEVRGAIHGRSY